MQIEGLFREPGPSLRATGIPVAGGVIGAAGIHFVRESSERY